MPHRTPLSMLGCSASHDMCVCRCWTSHRGARMCPCALYACPHLSSHLTMCVPPSCVCSTSCRDACMLLCPRISCPARVAGHCQDCTCVRDACMLLMPVFVSQSCRNTPLHPHPPVVCHIIHRKRIHRHNNMANIASIHAHVSTSSYMCRHLMRRCKVRHGIGWREAYWTTMCTLLRA